MSESIPKTDAASAASDFGSTDPFAEAAAPPPSHRFVLRLGSVQRSYLDETALHPGRILLLDEPIDAMVRLSSVGGFETTARLRRHEGGYFLQFVEANP